MIVREPTLVRDGDDVCLRAAIEPENGTMRAFSMEIRVDRSYEEWLDRSANPFVPAATALATALGEDLRVAAGISPRLRDGAERASRTYAEWWGYRPARVDAAGDPQAGPAGPGTGLFYSGGTDSVATLQRSRDRIIPERVTHLVSLQDLNPHYSRRTERTVWEEIERGAEDYGLPLVRMRTSATAVLRERMGWTRAFGAVLAGCALAIGPLLSRQLFGATVDDAHPRPRGSHPDLDRLWSTEGTSFRQDATEMGKMARVLYVGSSTVGLRHLKVCWIPDTPGNCGRCFKCLKTMSTLALGEDGAWVEAFDGPLTAEAILAHDLRVAQLWKVEDELVPRIRDELPEIADAWAQRAAEVRAHGPRRPWRRRQARSLRRLRRRAGRRAAKRWRRARKRVGAALGKG